jgi:hypothetical protein
LDRSLDNKALQESSAAIGFDLLARDEHRRIAADRVPDLEAAWHDGSSPAARATVFHALT